MKRIVVLVALLAIGWLSVGVAARQQARGGVARPEGLLQQPQGPWQPGRVAKIEKLRDNVYRILNTGSNCAAFVTDAGVLLVESGYAGWGPEILTRLREVTNKPITTVINTHAHVDHAAANPELGLAQNIEFVAHEATKANLMKDQCAGLSGPGAGACGAFKGENAKYLPRKTFKDTLSLKLGNLRVEMSYHGRGHTGGDIVVVFPQYRLAHVGDLLGWQGVPRLFAEDGGSTIDFPDTLAKAQAAIRNVDTIITGHQTVMPWQNWVEMKDFLRIYVDQVKAAHKAGRTVDEAAASIRWPEKYKVCPPEDTFVSQYDADYPKFHSQCTYRTDQMKTDTQYAYNELDKKK
jgi:glyoxylase-like metal-dependent hydrolase (beta-lactamase superfamily II)